MAGLVAGIGFKAIAGAALGKAASAGGSTLKWLGSLDLVHALLLFVALFGAWQTFGRWSQHRHLESVEAPLTAASNSLAAAAKDIATSQANEAKLRTAIAAQNAAVEQLGKQSSAQQQAAAKAVSAAANRAAEAEATASALRRSAAAKKPPAPNCEPSDALKEQWP